jgi:protein-lysine N-methyltransferase EEF2KMT
MDPALTQFYRQYLQQIHELSYPAPKVLLQPYAQEQIFHYMFDGSHGSPLPPVNYQRRVLKTILDKIESAIQDPDEDV